MNQETKMKNGNQAQVVRTTSAFDCGGRCPLRLKVHGGRIVGVEGDDAPEPEQLRACLRCRAFRQYVHHSERLLHPLKRTGEKGKGEFEQISWDEALDTIIEKLTETRDTYGNQGILLARGGGYLGALHGAGGLAKVLSLFGGYTTHYGNVSSEGAVWAVLAQYGSVMVGHSREDMMNSKLIILWGWDPARMISGTNTMYHLIKARESGIRVVCVDPRFNDSGSLLADQWIPIRPGTDAAMMVSMANVMIRENRHDQAFLDKYAVGFDQFKDYVMGKEDGVEKTPAWASEISGVPEQVIIDLAREYASTKPATLMDCQGPARSATGEQYIRCAMTLCAMTGNIGKSGGGAGGGLMGVPVGHMFRSSGIPGMKNPVETGGKSVRGSLDLRDRLTKRIHTNKLFDAILKGTSGGYPADIKAAWFVANNFLNQLGNTNKNARALKSLPFMISSELFMTPTARYADIILPVSSAAEKNDLTRPWPSGPYYTAINKAIEPRGECKSDWEIACALAEKLGFDDFNPHTESEWLENFVKLNPETGPQIKDYDKFREEGIYRVKLDEPIIAFQKEIEDPENNPFPTPSGKIEIFSQRVADSNNPLTPAIPKYLPAKEDHTDSLTKKYPLQLLTPHPRNRVHSELYEVEWLKETHPHKAWINPADAEPRGISDNDPIYVFNDRGKLIIPAFITEKIVRGVVAIYEGAWYDPDENGVCRGGCVNVLTLDEHSGGGASVLKTALVEVELAKEGE